MKCTVWAAILLAVAMGTPRVQADDTIYGTKIGAMNSLGMSIPNGGILSALQEGVPGTAQFGMMWDRPAEVTSVTITHSFNTFRPLETASYPTQALVYVSPTKCLGSITLPPPDENGKQTYTFDNAIFASNSYLMLVVTETYTPTGSGNYNPFVGHFEFAATAAGPADRNVNLDSGVTITPSDPGPFDEIDPKNHRVLHDDRGRLVNVTHSIFSNNDTDRNVWMWKDQDALSLTAAYGTPQEIASIGLGFAGDMPDLACPKFIYVYATFEDGTFSESFRFDLGGLTPDGITTNTQYGRYGFGATLENVVALTIEFPDGNNHDNWWINPDAVGYSHLFGLTEFQAFAPPVPEPATMVLLSLGGLTMLKRRRGA